MFQEIFWDLITWIHIFVCNDDYEVDVANAQILCCIISYK
jgi:hypothetical protein